MLVIILKRDEHSDGYSEFQWFLALEKSQFNMDLRMKSQQIGVPLNVVFCFFFLSMRFTSKKDC